MTTNTNTNAPQNTTTAEISDGAAIFGRGYRKYEGARSGIGGAVRSLMWQTIRSILGLGRPARHKVFPVIVLVIAAIPAVVYLGATIIIRDIGQTESGITVNYYELFNFSVFPIVIFSAMVTPEALVRDRLDGMVSMYLSTPLNRLTYLYAKVAAVLSVMLIITFGPVLLALVGYTIIGDGPDGLVEWVKLCFRLFLGGLVIAMVVSAIAMACSSITNRRAFASIAVIMVTIGGLITSEILGNITGYSDLYGLLSPLETATETATRILGESSANDNETALLAFVSTGEVAFGCAAWFLVSAAVIGHRYHRLEAD